MAPTVNAPCKMLRSRWTGAWKAPRLGQSGQTTKSALPDTYHLWTSKIRIRSPAGQSVVQNCWSVPSCFCLAHSPPSRTAKLQTAIARPYSGDRNAVLFERFRDLFAHGRTSVRIAPHDESQLLSTTASVSCYSHRPYPNAFRNA